MPFLKIIRYNLVTYPGSNRHAYKWFLDFFRIFVMLIVFIFDSRCIHHRGDEITPVHSLQGNCGSLMYSSLDSRDFLTIRAGRLLGSWPKWFNLCWCQKHSGVEALCCISQQLVVLDTEESFRRFLRGRRNHFRDNQSENELLVTGDTVPIKAQDD